ncbi:hypothetical protein CEXT_646401 [Caerostris extrusa]|uniref:Uncharacterized protein n=1 Tax=Caerostris extrusa TaxID=172846 RepID=A0AAV4MDB6_CAEEX|nr:hypothetical protein CEXT_646401 [Caerostris extrusa]
MCTLDAKFPGRWIGWGWIHPLSGTIRSLLSELFPMGPFEKSKLRRGPSCQDFCCCPRRPRNARMVSLKIYADPKYLGVFDFGNIDRKGAAIETLHVLETESPV